MSTEPPFTVGVEEEYLLVDLATRDVDENPPTRLLQACTERGAGHINPEFLRSQLEVSTRVCHSVAEMREELRRLRAIIVERYPTTIRHPQLVFFSTHSPSLTDLNIDLLLFLFGPFRQSYLQYAVLVLSANLTLID